MRTAQSGCWLRSGGFQKQPDSGIGFLRIWMLSVFKDWMGFVGRIGLVCFSIGSGQGFFQGIGTGFFWIWMLPVFQGSGFVAALTETNVYNLPPCRNFIR